MTVEVSGDRTIRWGWALFGALLIISIASFSWTADWPALGVLDVVAVFASLVAAAGVLVYAFSAAIVAPTFWSWFRWLFAAVVTAQGFVHAWQAAHAQGYSASGAVLFVFGVALVIGPIFLFQWIAMSRLSHVDDT